MTDEEMVEQDVKLGQAVYDWFQSTSDPFPYPGCVEHRHYYKRKLMRTTTIRACAAEPFPDGTIWYDKLWDVRDYKKDRLAILGEEARLWFARDKTSLPHWVFETIERQSLRVVEEELVLDLGWAARPDSRSYSEKLERIMEERSLEPKCA